jgi:hypothetical protein
LAGDGLLRRSIKCVAILPLTMDVKCKGREVLWDSHSTAA